MKDTARLKITEAEAREWTQGLSKYFAKVELCAYFEILKATPAIEFKKKALERIIKELKAMDA